MIEPFKPNDVVGETDNHRVNGIAYRDIKFKELHPKIQLALQEGQAYKKRWERLKAWLGEDCTMRGWVPLPGNVIEKMDDLESQPAKEGE